MARAKSTKATNNTTTIEEVVTPIKETEVKETVSITEAKAEPIKKYIIANSTVQMHKKPDLFSASVVGIMTIGVAYVITEETKNICGTFYKLDNGLYVTRNSDYTIF